MVEFLKSDTIINYSYTPYDIFSPYKNKGIEIIQIKNDWENFKNKCKL